MTILVTGGLGYIGSFMTKLLIEKGYSVVVADKAQSSSSLISEQGAKLETGDVLDKNFVSSLFQAYQFSAVLHFAAYISLNESMENPGKYFQNNIGGVINILDAMGGTSCKNFIFSSTAAVYGSPMVTPIPENHEKNPTNPYGQSKLMAEIIIEWYRKIKGINYAVLRYFNAAGAALDGRFGEKHIPETHIIPNALTSVLEDKEFNLYGGDYDTSDGTCIRDYIHVEDLVSAHLLALNKLSTPGGYIYNVGTGVGHSNREVTDMIEKVTGKKIKIRVLDPRTGDAPILVADPAKIKNELGFVPSLSDLETIISSAWKWHQRKTQD